MLSHYTNDLPQVLNELKPMKTWALEEITKMPYPEHYKKKPLSGDKWNSPEKLLTYDEAYSLMLKTNSAALGLYLPLGGLKVPNTIDKCYIIIDLDGCLDEHGNWCGTEQQYKTYQLIRGSKSYIELSVSGTGYHCICIGKYENSITKSYPLEGIPEVYTEKHAVVLTGRPLDGLQLPIVEATPVLNDIYTKLSQLSASKGNDIDIEKALSEDIDLFSSNEPITDGRKTTLTSLTGKRTKWYVENHFAWSDKVIAEKVQAEIEQVNATRCVPPLDHAMLMDRCGIKSIQSFIDRDRAELRIHSDVMPQSEYYKPFYKLNNNGMAIGVYHSIIGEYVSNRMNYFFLGKRTEGKIPTLFIYSDGYYKEDTSSLLNRRIANCIPQKLQNAATLKGIKELFSMVSDKYIDDAKLNQLPSKSCVPFKDCIYDMRTGQTYKNDPKYYEVNQLPWTYEEIQKAGEPVYFTKLMNEQIFDDEQRENVYKFFAYSMTTDTRFQIILIFIGDRGTGKSTLLELLQNILGTENYSTLSMQDMDPTASASRFRTITLLHKMANICGDISRKSITDTSVLKRLSGEDTISVEDKGKSVISMRSYAKLVFSANTQPVQLDEPSDAWYKRFETVQMRHRPEKPDPTYREKLKAEIPAIIKVLLQYGKALYTDGMKQSQLSIEMLQENRENADSVASFIAECTEPIEKVDKAQTTPKEYAYSKYREFCQDHGRKICSDTEFYQRMRANGIEEIRQAIYEGTRQRRYLIRLTKYVS